MLYQILYPISVLCSEILYSNSQIFSLLVKLYIHFINKCRSIGQLPVQKHNINPKTITSTDLTDNGLLEKK